jgi:hypothetical protein
MRHLRPAFAALARSARVGRPAAAAGAHEAERGGIDASATITT